MRLLTTGVLVSIAFWARLPIAFASGLVDGLTTNDRRSLERAVDDIEHAPAGTPELASALLAAARASEDRLSDPVRALALYVRIERDFPQDGSAYVAARRADQLRAQIGSGGAYATDFAQLIAQADQLSVDEVTRRATALTATAWSGGAEVALWLAGYLQRVRRFGDAEARYAEVGAKWPNSNFATRAARGRAGNALEARDWRHAVVLANALPATSPSDVAIREQILRAAKRGAARDQRYLGAWGLLGLAIVALVASLAQALWRHGQGLHGRWRHRLRPPFEVLFLAPIGLVIVIASFTAHKAIAPAVVRIMGTGVVLAWLSGAALDALRGSGRSVRVRSMIHIAACAIGIIAISYIALTRDDLLDMLIETVRFGPEPA